ncbi:TrbI/VirB10 family protein [Pontixanthobacter aquaemixtae]|uniref:Type VI secretion protein n=1 Tax=Pontixanthobacter aquaemixtae TaxID=1958940 RepID=A0A844ZQX3_9SPHN|nr:TrbI/VirB10 family protein [Pontixanthobacter aquaemixtae]MXO89207.1 type VI secretion protein [Pontixanthobacter aquaemixtae]
MRLKNKLPGKVSASNDVDPREQESAEIIDLASRNSFPAVTQRKGKSDGLALAAGVALVAAIGGVTFWGMNSAKVPPPQGVGGQQPAQPAAPANKPAAAQQPVASGAVQPAAVPQLSDPAPSPVLANTPVVNPGPAVNPYSTPTVVFDAGGTPLGTVSVPAAAQGEAPAQVVPGGRSANDFASRVGGVGGGPAQAKAMVNPATTVTEGTLIPAILETAIDTNVPGFVRAVVSQDVRSFDGKNVLVPRSSRLIGQYQSGVQNGQKRAYVIWTRLIRPDGASVNLQSPAVGFDGTTGLAGKVSSNFFQRFGSAMLLSVVGGLSAIGTGGASVILGGGGQAAAAAAQQDSQIGPTIRVRMGEPIRVFTARDLDFSSVTGG